MRENDRSSGADDARHGPTHDEGPEAGIGPQPHCWGNDLWRSLIERTPSNVSIIDRAGIVRYTNHVVRGLSIEDVVGASIFDFIEPESHGDVRRALASAIDRGVTDSYIGRAIGPDGTVATYDVKVGPVTESDAIVGASLVSTDITDQVETEERLKLALEARERSARWYQAVVEHASDIVFVLNREMNIRYASPSVATELGHVPAEMVGTNGATYIHPEDQALAWETFRSAQRQGATSETAVLRIAAENGPWQILEFTTSNALSDPAVQGVILNARNVTAREEAQGALRKSEEEYRWLVENLNDGIWVLDADYGTTFVNPRMQEMLGYTEAELLGRAILEFVPEDERTEVGEALGRLRERPGSADEIEFLRKDGSPLYAAVEKSVLTDPDGSTKGSIISARDITAQRAAEEEGEVLREQLAQAQKMEAVGRLAGGVAHDFNNLLTVLLGYSDLALARIPEDSAAHEHVVQIKSIAGKAADLAAQLLIFSRRHELRIEPHSLGDITQGVSKMLGRMLGEDIRISLELDPRCPIVEIDECNVEQLLVNLAVNARDAMPEGGSLTVRTKEITLTERDCRTRAAARPGRFARISVIDTGSGIEPEVAEHIFEPFYTTKTEGQSTGLGLAVVFGVAKRHGGWVELESQVGAGSTFHVYFPAASAVELPVRLGNHPAELRRGSGEKLLLVEDEKAVRDLMAKMLSENGYSVQVAEGVVQAVGVFKEEKGAFDMIVSDVVLTDGRGTEFKELLEVMGSKIPILLTSGHIGRQSVLDIIEKGHLPLLTKPFTASALLNAVAEGLLGGPGSV